MTKFPKKIVNVHCSIVSCHLLLMKGLPVDHSLEPRDPLFQRWMRTEEIDQSSTPERIHDEHVRGCRIRIHGSALNAGLELLQSARQVQRVATNARSGGIG